jgi:hypothetical protein
LCRFFDITIEVLNIIIGFISTLTTDIVLDLINDLLLSFNQKPCQSDSAYDFIKEIKKTKSKHPTPNSVPFSAWLTKRTSNLFSCNENKLDNKTTSKLLDISVVNIENIHVLKNSKSSITICTTGIAKINESELKVNETYIIKFQLLDRSNSKSSEFFMHKSIIGEIRSKESAMIDNIRQFTK